VLVCGLRVLEFCGILDALGCLGKLVLFGLV